MHGFELAAIQELEQIKHLLEKIAEQGDTNRGRVDLVCNCNQHESGRSTNGWHCPVHGQMW